MSTNAANITNERTLAAHHPDRMRFTAGGSKKAAAKQRKRIRNKRNQAWRNK